MERKWISSPPVPPPRFDVGESRELKVAAGDWLLLQANHGKEFINGERVQVREIQDGRIALADGRALPADFNAFTHGYAVTSHSSQSKTVDEVLLVASSKSFAAVNREQFYVSISRGRERVHVFTDDAELLARRVTDSHERKAAVELQALRDDLAKLGFTRKAAGRSLAADGGRLSIRVVPCAERRRATSPDAPVSRSTARQVVEDVRRWVLAHGHHEKTEQATTSGAVKQAETISPATTQTTRVRPNFNPNVPPPRRSRGIGI